MVSITLSVPDAVRELMHKHDEINWSGFVRKAIERKAQELESIEELRTKIREEKSLIEWTVQTQRAGRAGRAKALRNKGLL
ncbi:hypothetical protein HY641_02990 [Candidatus Woesearchaeota archaeon]|nr:hypothetical protein [Candidatus Woesearchaeota archaeon]